MSFGYEASIKPEEAGLIRIVVLRVFDVIGIGRRSSSRSHGARRGTSNISRIVRDVRHITNLFFSKYFRGGRAHMRDRQREGGRRGRLGFCCRYVCPPSRDHPLFARPSKSVGSRRSEEAGLIRVVVFRVFDVVDPVGE